MVNNQQAQNINAPIPIEPETAITSSYRRESPIDAGRYIIDTSGHTFYYNGLNTMASAGAKLVASYTSLRKAEMLEKKRKKEEEERLEAAFRRRELDALEDRRTDPHWIETGSETGTRGLY